MCRRGDIASRPTPSATGRNDAYTAYLHMGAPKQLSPEQVRLLNDASTGKAESTSEKSIADGDVLEPSLPLRANDVRLITLTPVAPK